jgi:hypothetical protein
MERGEGGGEEGEGREEEGGGERKEEEWHNDIKDRVGSYLELWLATLSEN